MVTERSDVLVVMLEDMLTVPVCQLPPELIDQWFGQLCLLLGQLPISLDRGLWYAKAAKQYDVHFSGGRSALLTYLIARASYEDVCWMAERQRTYPPLPMGTLP